MIVGITSFIISRGTGVPVIFLYSLCASSVDVLFIRAPLNYYDKQSRQTLQILKIYYTKNQLSDAYLKNGKVTFCQTRTLEKL